jgi:hypothetical protein
MRVIETQTREMKKGLSSSGAALDIFENVTEELLAFGRA